MADSFAQDLEILRKFSVFCSSTTGMDRIARTTSFISKFVKSHYCSKAQFAEQSCKEKLNLLSKKLDNLSLNLGGFRRILRWSRPFYLGNNLLNIIENFKKAKTTTGKAKELHDIFFYIFMIVADINDVVGWLAFMGLLSNDKLAQKSLQLNNKFYVVECLIWLFYYIREVYNFQFNNKAFDKENKDHRFKAFNLKLSVIKYIIDAICAYNAIDAKFITPKTNSKIGLISSMIACYQSWPK
ncbi:hypothetical protein ABPG72_016277 [Tetrahymena utriculariae]